MILTCADLVQYNLNSENVTQILCDLRNIFFPQLFLSMSTKYSQLEPLKIMEILSGEQMRGLRKM